MQEEQTGESRIFAGMAYFFGIMIALVIYLIKKEDGYVRFHAMQAMLFDLAMMAVSVPLSIALFAGMFLAAFSETAILMIAFWAATLGFVLLSFLLRLFFAFKAFTGSRFRLPFIGKHAERIAAG